MRVSLDHPESTALYAAVIARPGHVRPCKLSHAQRVTWAELVAESCARYGNNTVKMPRLPKTRGTPVSAKITSVKAAAIRRDPRPVIVIAEEHGISINTVYSIKRGETWRDA